MTPAPETSPMSLGQRGEQYICEQLHKQGWTILRRNFRRRSTELDILAQKGGTLIVVEVKTRRYRECRSRTSPLEERLPQRKKVALLKGALKFLEESNLQPETIRFDMACLEYDGEQKNPKVSYYVNLGIDQSILGYDN